MTKKQLLSVLTLSALALAQAGLASADEVLPVDPSTPATEQVVTTSPVETPTQTTETPVVPADPTTPSDQPTAPAEPTTPEVPAEPSTPSTEAPVAEAPATETEPSTQPDTPETTTPSTETGGQTGQSGTAQVGEVSKVTNQVVTNVSASAPVTLESGASIVDIQSGVATLSDGTKANLTDLGATKNADNTYSIKKSDGEMVTLPETGEVASILSVIGLVASSIGVGGFLKKKKQ